MEPLRQAYTMAKERWCPRRRPGHLRGHWSTRRADQGRTGTAHLQAVAD